ncbi:TetR/AcrR family transcriptional regulator [Hydrogenophaga sp. OTU3427]|uniref:TetR/AcrR family transcriptional regulator n=1 Tax=Hydrogenophaga sp. OTU3427 TaxID=3043856 RepID=UPI00313CC9A4
MATTAAIKKATRGGGTGVRVDDRQGQLLEIACRLFARQGYKGTSLRDIAEEAQITKAALYYHFPNKEALYQQIVLESTKALVEAVREAVAQAQTPVEKVRAFMLTSAEVFERTRDAWVAGSNAFWDEGGSGPRSVAVSQRDEYEKLLRSCIAEGIRSGDFRPVEPAIAGRLLLSTINQLSRWHSPKGPLSPRQVIEQYLDVVLSGLRTPTPAR